MAKATARLLPGGVSQILSAASALHNYALAGFTMGDTAGYVAADADTQARGNIVFTGTPDLMSLRQLSTTATRVTLMVPEGVGPFIFGNVMIYTASTDSGTPVPFAEIVLPFQVEKHLAQYSDGLLTYANPGDRLLVSMTLNHKVIQPDDPTSGITVVVDVISPEYASLPFYDTEANVPAANLIPWSQFVINNLLSTGGPGLVSKRSDGTLWVYPMLCNIHDPKYHVMSGGRSGDHYAVDKHDWLWGGRFTDRQNPNIQRASVGGMPFAGYSPTDNNYYGGVKFTDITRGSST